MNTAVKSHFRASNNAAIKTREVRQKISSQWGSLNVHLQGISRQNVFFQPTTRMMSCEGTCDVRCVVARVRVRAKYIMKSVRDVGACSSFLGVRCATVLLQTFGTKLPENAILERLIPF